MHRHCGTNNRAPRWTFMDPCKPEVRPGAREESASPAWLAAPAMNARDTTKVYILRLTLDVDRHYIGSVTATTHQEKGIITLESKLINVNCLHFIVCQNYTNVLINHVLYQIQVTALLPFFRSILHLLLQLSKIML